MYDIDTEPIDPEHLAEGGVAVVETVDALEKEKGKEAESRPTGSSTPRSEEDMRRVEEAEKARRHRLKAVFKRALLYSAILTFIVAILGASA